MLIKVTCDDWEYIERHGMKVHFSPDLLSEDISENVFFASSWRFLTKFVKTKFGI